MNHSFQRQSRVAPTICLKVCVSKLKLWFGVIRLARGFLLEFVFFFFRQIFCLPRSIVLRFGSKQANRNHPKQTNKQTKLAAAEKTHKASSPLQKAQRRLTLAAALF
ncbi:MAG TPA: hypothetical protein PLD20_32745 [Blastocatellia bacterium]|nr:hypothetical protein [Blastocatellia bacterium]